MKILIISEYIAPVQAVASIRWTKIAKYIKRAHPDAEITVLTNQKEYTPQRKAANLQKKDALLEKDLQYIDTYREAPYNLPMKLYYSLKSSGGSHLATQLNREKHSSLSNTLAKRLKTRLMCDVYDLRDWMLARQVYAYIRQDKTAWDVIISSYGPIWTHLVAEKIKQGNPHALWFADFRDPYARDVEPLSVYQRHKKTTEKHGALADAILRVAEGIEPYTSPVIPIYTIPNGYDPQEKLLPLPPPKFNIVYVGVLYAEQTNIGVVAGALRELCEEGQIQREDAEIFYAGNSGDTARELAAKYGAQEYIHDYGFVPRQESLEMQQNAAILLALYWNTSMEHGLWTGKIYEYMMEEKPILYVVTGDVPYSEPSKQIHHLGGYCYEQCRHEETYQGMKDYILKKYQEWKATGNVTVQQDREYVEQYAYPHIAEQVWRLIQEGTSQRNENRTVKEN